MAAMGILLSRAAHKPTYERRDAPARAIVYGLAGLFGVIALSAAAVAGLFALWGSPTPTMTPRAPLAKNVPRLEIQEGENRASLEAIALARLKGYAWADRDAGLVRIPIERAMELQVEQGWTK
jgi:hypothetical protein